MEAVRGYWGEVLGDGRGILVYMQRDQERCLYCYYTVRFVYLIHFIA